MVRPVLQGRGKPHSERCHLTLASVESGALAIPPLACVHLANSVLPRHSDYINPIDLCNRLNTYIIPEAAVHGFLTFLFLINGYWLALVLNLPLLAWNIKKYVCVRRGALWDPRWKLHADQPFRIVDNTHLLDATEIFRKLNVHKKVSCARFPGTTCRTS